MAAPKNGCEVRSENELRASVGQLFVVGFHGHVANEDIKTLIATHKVGAVILFQRNVHSPTQLRDLTNSLQAIARDAGHAQELFIGIDQENGLVTRIRYPIAAQLPGPMALGAAGDSSDATTIATATAGVLRSFGINFNYAPVADISSEPRNPVVGVRSPSDNPEAVGRFVSAQIKGLRQGGIVPCVKHFPGHGDTTTDSHHGLPVISKSKALLNACELVPFRRAVVEGIEAVMTAHIAMPEIGDLSLPSDHPTRMLPASLNYHALRILREEMKYDGLIISDCLEMDGVRATYGTETSAVMALKAGTDCVMICHTMAAQLGAIEQVVQAIKSEQLSMEAIEASMDRVRKLKRVFLSNETKTISVDGRKPMIELQTRMASEIYSRSTTVVRSDARMFPISKTSNVVFINSEKASAGGGAVESGDIKVKEQHTPMTYTDLLQMQNSNVVEIRLLAGNSLTPDSEKAIEEASAIILATKNANLNLFQRNLGLSLGKKYGSKLIVVATCDPYDFLEETDIKNYLAIYEPTLPAFKSAVDVIFGIKDARGTLPVGKSTTSHEIRILSNSEDDCRTLWTLWQEIFPEWPIQLPRLTKILQCRSGKHYIHEKGFCISYLLDGGRGKIAAIGVLTQYRGKGLATALLRQAQKNLRSEFLSEGTGDLTSLGIGSDFPRFWPGLPFDLPDKEKQFFLHRGFRKSTHPTARDLYRNITKEVAPAAVLEKVSKLPLKFAPWSADLYHECMTKQKANFKNIGWIQAYERLAAQNQHHEVMVAFDRETNAQVGWTIMSSLSSVVCDSFAFLPLAPSKDKTGLIACVGVDEAARGKGVGLALLVKAMENMRQRGIEGVLIDWVVIRGFYENLGFEVLWEYDGYEW